MVFFLTKLPKFVSGYTEFTSFSARMNEHDGSAVRYTKQVRAGVPSLAKFHKYSMKKTNKNAVIEASPIVQHFNSSQSLPANFVTIVGNRLRVANLVGKEKLALSKYSPILTVVGQCGGSIGKQGDHTEERGSKYYTALCAKNICNDQTENVQGSRFLSISADGSIGNDHKAGEGVRARIFNKRNKGRELQDIFVGVAELKREDAPGTLGGIKEQLKKVGVDLDSTELTELLADIHDHRELSFCFINANFDGA